MAFDILLIPKTKDTVNGVLFCSFKVYLVFYFGFKYLIYVGYNKKSFYESLNFSVKKNGSDDVFLMKQTEPFLNGLTEQIVKVFFLEKHQLVRKIFLQPFILWRYH